MGRMGPLLSPVCLEPGIDPLSLQVLTPIHTPQPNLVTEIGSYPSQPHRSRIGLAPTHQSRAMSPQTPRTGWYPTGKVGSGALCSAHDCSSRAYSFWPPGVATAFQTNYLDPFREDSRLAFWSEAVTQVGQVTAEATWWESWSSNRVTEP